MGNRLGLFAGNAHTVGSTARRACRPTRLELDFETFFAEIEHGRLGFAAVRENGLHPLVAFLIIGALVPHEFDVGAGLDAASNIERAPGSAVLRRQNLGNAGVRRVMNRERVIGGMRDRGGGTTGQQACGEQCSLE